MGWDRHSDHQHYRTDCWRVRHHQPRILAGGPQYVLLPVIDLLHRVIPSMRANGGGRILCITTIGVETVQPSMVLSTATRMAITGIARTLSVELAHDNIRV